MNGVSLDDNYWTQKEKGGRRRVGGVLKTFNDEKDNSHNTHINMMHTANDTDKQFTWSPIPPIVWGLWAVVCVCVFVGIAAVPFIMPPNTTSEVGVCGDVCGDVVMCVVMLCGDVVW